VNQGNSGKNEELENRDKNTANAKQKSQLNVTNPRGHEEDSGLLSHSKNSSTITTNIQRFWTSLTSLEEATLWRMGKMRAGREVREMEDSFSLFIKHIIYFSFASGYFRTN